MSLLILRADEVRASLPMIDAIAAMREAFAALSAGRAEVPDRIHLSITRNSGISLVMPAYLDSDQTVGQALAVKVVSLFDGNRVRGLARIQAAVNVIEPTTGRIIALLEGATLTAIRTAAASGLATDLLARPDASTLAIFGAGVQARMHLEAMLAVRPIQVVKVYGRTKSKVEEWVEELTGEAGRKLRSRTGLRPEYRVASSSMDALKSTDIVCTATTSREQVFNDRELPDGVHINAIGSFTPDAREIPAETVCRSTVFVDSRRAAWEEAGDLIQPLRAGLIQQSHVRGELGELVDGHVSGRVCRDEITFFKSVGVAVQDAVAARVAITNATRDKLGMNVDW